MGLNDRNRNTNLREEREIACGMRHEVYGQVLRTMKELGHDICIWEVIGDQNITKSRHLTNFDIKLKHELKHESTLTNT